MPRSAKIIIVVVLIVLVIALAAYFLFRGGENGKPSVVGSLFGGGLPSTGGGSSGGGPPAGGSAGGGGKIVEGGTLPVTNEEGQKLVKLSQDPATGIGLKPKDDKVLFFKLGVGHLFEVPFNGLGGEARISNITIRDVLDAKWSKGSAWAFITTGNGAVWLHRTGTSTVETGAFQDSILSADFSPTEDLLASFIKNGDAYSLYASAPDGKKAKTVFTTKIPDFETTWITKNLIALKTKT